MACQDRPEPELHPIYRSVASDSALFYYKLGWKQIMDEGNYGKAERFYRKVVEHAPHFLIGKNVLGRLTLDTEERIKIQQDTEAQKDKVVGDERLILDVYSALVSYTISRDLKSANLHDIREKTFKIAENNLRIVVHKYPEEIYMKAEYIEFVHSLYGPEQALDSLEELTTDDQKNNPFLLGYSASLKSEIGNFEDALQEANQLLKSLKKANIPKPYAVLADIYLKMDSLDLASNNANTAVALDPRNLDASRLKAKIDTLLGKIQIEN